MLNNAIENAMTPSLMDPSVMITQKKWGVTMTCDPTGFHARLVFEGLKEERDPNPYFYQVAHLTAPLRSICKSVHSHTGSIDLSDEKDREKFTNVKYSKKTQTWLRTKEDIEALIHNIKQETGREVPFHICGRKSIFAHAVEIFEIYDPLVAEIKKQSEILFLHIYDSAQNNGDYTGMSGEDFTTAIAEVFRGINRYMIAETPSYQELVERVSATTKVVQEHQNSCVSWALRNLETVGIRVGDVALDKLITITDCYTKYNPGEIVPSAQNIDRSDELLVEGNSISKKERVRERYVCYNIQRDKRTYTWKVLDDQYKKSKNLTIAGSLLLPFSIVGGVVATIATLVFPPLAPFTITGGVVSVTGFLGSGAGMLSHGISLKNRTLEEARAVGRATQPGNVTISPELRL